jgi:hypothetical protein
MSAARLSRDIDELGLPMESPKHLPKRMTIALAAREGRVRKGQHEAGTRFRIRRIDAGKLELPSGRICVADAYMADQFPPLNRLVPPGQYPVELVIARLPKNIPFGDERCAFLIVTFAQNQPAKWESVTAIAEARP